FLQCLDAGAVHFFCQLNADVAEVPGFVGVTGDGFFAFGVADDKAVLVGVGGQPDAFGRRGETGFQAARAVVGSREVGGPAGLMLAVAGAGAEAVGLGLAVAAHHAAVD